MAQEGKGGSWKTILIIAGGGLALAVFALVVGIAMLGGGGGPNKRGAQAAQYVNPTDAKTSSFISQLSTTIDPSSFLQNNRTDLDKINIQIDELQNYWVTNNILSGQDLNDAKTIMSQIKQDVDKLIAMMDAVNGASSLAQVTNKTEVEALRQGIKDKLLKLTNIVSKALGYTSGNASTAINLARALIERNATQGNLRYRKGLIPEIKRKDIINGTYKGRSLVDAPVSMDCTGFVSYVLMAAGVLEGRKTTEFLAMDVTNFIRLNPDKDGDGSVTGEEIKTSLEGGLLLPGDVVLSGLSNLSRIGGQSHAVLIMTSDYSSSQALAESSGARSPNGVHYQSWQSRLGSFRKYGDKIGDNLLFIRPKYPTP